MYVSSTGLTRADYAKRNRHNKRAYVENLKRSPCMDCKNSFPPCCMDFDHRPGETKIFQVSQGVKDNKPYAVLDSEMAKCDLVCANCHRIRTFERKKVEGNFKETPGTREQKYAFIS